MFDAPYHTEAQALAVIQDTTAGELKREGAIRYLRHYASRDSVRVLIDSLEDDDFGVRWEAAITLAGYGEAAIPALLEALSDPRRIDCPRLREGAYQVFANNASDKVAAMTKDLRKAIKGPAADLATMEAAHRLLQRMKMLH